MISIIMPCYNRAYDLRRVLDAYQRQTISARFDLIAINDASTDGTGELLETYQAQRYDLRVLHQETNQGPAAARNLGLALATAPLIAFVGDDILPTEQFVQDHMDAHAQHPAPEIAILGRTVWPQDLVLNTLMLHIDGAGAEQFSYYYLKDGQEYDFRHLYTSNVSLKTEFLKTESVWFDTSFPYAAFEDVELSYRLSRRGLKIIYSAKPQAYHYHYHNVWTFSKRQYQSGLMACLLVKKHPELRKMILGERWLLRLLWLRVQGWRQPVMPYRVEWLERQALFRASAFEHVSSSGDAMHIYTQVLRYFYRKGIIEGMLKPPGAIRTLGVYAHKVLAPLLSGS
jgi:glycosyltransferase involved in cell wall biosynthesis